MKEIKKILPEKIWQKIEVYQDEIEEIRIRLLNPLSARICGETKKISDYCPTVDDIRQILSKATEFSMHSYINELKNGFITINHGHRIGVCGEAVFDGKILINFREITSLNIRIARQSINLNQEIFQGIDGKSILIISPPNFGKTTLLREICKYLSSKNYNLSIIDERFEISSRCNLGQNVDVLLGVFKKQGTYLMLKSMSPDYIILDEITSETDILHDISSCGVKIIASCHAKNLDEILLYKKHILQHFDAVIEIYLEENTRKYKFKGREYYA